MESDSPVQILLEDIHLYREIFEHDGASPQKATKDRVLVKIWFFAAPAMRGKFQLLKTAPFDPPYMIIRW